MSKTKVIIDVDKAIELYNINNPKPKNEQMTRDKLSELTGIHREMFNTWKNKSTPSVISRVNNILNALECEFEDLISKTEKDETA